MSDGIAAQHNRTAMGHPDRVAMRTSRLQHLERLLGTIAQHLQSTGNRHGDVVAQLQDRLHFLDRTTASDTMSPDLDRHLALFEAQLTSLAIRTGVATPAPVAAPPRPVVNAPVQQGHVVPPPPAQHAPPQQMQAAPGALPEPRGLPTPREETFASRPAEKPIGAPPPSQPMMNRPELNALTRQSDVTFEDAVAAEQAEQARATAAAAEQTEGDKIFAYHPPMATGDGMEPAVGSHANRESQSAVPNVDPAPVLASKADSGSRQSLPEPRGGDVGISVTQEFPPIPAEAGEDAPIDDRATSQEVPSDHDASMGSLRSELEEVLSHNTETPAAVVQEPVVYKADLDAPAAIVESDVKTPAADGASSDDFDVRGEIERLTRQLDSMTSSVERLESGLEESRTEVPNLIEKAANAAATQVAEQFKSADTQVNRRIDELHDLLDDRVTPQQQRAPIVAPLPVSEQPVPAQVVEPRTDAIPGESRVNQAKKSMLKHLAPVGNVLARRGKRVEPTIEPYEQEPEMPAEAPSVPEGQRAHPATAPVFLDEQDNLSTQSMSDLRKSLFQNLKDSPTPAIVLVFGAVTVLSGLLFWNVLSDTHGNDGRLQQTASLESTTSGDKIGGLPSVEVTHSTAPMSPKDVEAVRTAGTVKPTSGGDDFLEQFPDLQSDVPPIKPTALKPDPGGTLGTGAGAGGSKLELPPLATGPLSLRVAAASGDAAAQFEVASRLAQGNGVTRDAVAAVKWYTRAASAGHARAQYRLAALYERGAGVATDTGRAKIWYTRAAQQGNVKAMHNLAVLYAGQAAGSPNYVNAAQWFERAAEHGLADSQFNVAILYLNGLGVAKDRRSAYKWFSLAAKQGDQEAVRRLKNVTTQLSGSELAAAKDLVKNWRAKPIRDDANKTAAWQPKSTTSTVRRVVAKADPVPATKTVVTPGAIGVAEVKKVQRLLNGLGYNVGSPDGRVGGKTKASIKSFQTRNGMIPTGTVDHALIERIEGAVREKAAKLGQI